MTHFAVINENKEFEKWKKRHRILELISLASTSVYELNIEKVLGDNGYTL